MLKPDQVMIDVSNQVDEILDDDTSSDEEDYNDIMSETCTDPDTSESKAK